MISRCSLRNTSRHRRGTERNRFFAVWRMTRQMHTSCCPVDRSRSPRCGGHISGEGNNVAYQDLKRNIRPRLLPVGCCRLGLEPALSCFGEAALSTFSQVVLTL